MDDDYHFGCQFTADLIAMNTAGQPLRASARTELQVLSASGPLKTRMLYNSIVQAPISELRSY